MLTIHPETPHAGLHHLELKLPGYEGLQVTARTSYWAAIDNDASTLAH